MSFADKKVDLNRYQCARCHRAPAEAQELFQGCTCGHRLFRIIRNDNEAISLQRARNNGKKADRLNFLTVQELEVGRYSINVEKLLSDKPDEKTSSPVIVGNNGVFSIHLKPYKKS